MTRTEKYSFKIAKNQHKVTVPETWEDVSEQGVLEYFEGCCLHLKNKQKDHYTMIELGSNWSYYSLLFKHIIGKNKTLNIMVEPIEDSLDLGKMHFKINNCNGLFYKKGVTEYMDYYGAQKKLDFITLDEILAENNLEQIDLLHADIDCSEVEMLNYNLDFFKNKKALNVFILTHGETYATECKQIFETLPYKLLKEFPFGTQGGDGLLIYNLKR
jgi:hypothetical protein